MEIKKEHLAWVDLLRISACFFVILAHCCDPFVGQLDNNRAEFLSGVFWGSLVRPCVPIFVMMTGILLFPVKMELTAFYKKRIARIVIALVFWSLAAPIAYFIYLNYIHTTVSPAISMDEHTLSATLTKLYTFVFNFNYDTIPYWYLYMLIGLYLVMPIISAWMAQASQKDIKAVIVVWLISTLIPYIQLLAPLVGYGGNYGNKGLLGVCDWNAYGTFYYVSGFIGYVILAHYLVRFPLQWSMKKTLGVAIPLFLIGYAITAGGFITIQNYFPGDFTILEVVWYFSGANVFMMTFSVFIGMQKIQLKNSPVIAKIASLTFGIYLCHFIFVQISYDMLYDRFNIPAYILIPLMAALTFAISYCVIWVMSRFKLTRRVIL